MSVKKFLESWRWEGVTNLPYADGEGFAGATRKILVEGSEVILRYFELEVKGFSRRERHPHEHAVIILRGTGEVLVGDAWTEVKPFDAVHIPGNVEHQLKNTGPEPFGFLCAIRPKTTS
ncbi:MAG TPA: cupin domain-containing protein [Thermoanaerobaculia bacterium]|nr:cupin domain-containing protein [Thermoanaerobaculia bacterium]HUM29701.1 cupin domain-containing protein [Thermoanaerobaculia bacterium]HXK67001.1 cupin domain-containing protein [Thermoanaerobaculia bacterium]